MKKVQLEELIANIRPYWMKDVDSASGGVSGGGGGTGAADAPINAQYVVMAADATLTHERVLTDGAHITITDGGAGANVTINVDETASYTWTGDHSFTQPTEMTSLMVGASLPATGDGTLHVHTASAGSVAAPTSANDTVVEGSGDTGITILTPAANAGKLYFGSPSGNSDGGIEYNHADSALYLRSNGSSRAGLLSTSLIFYQNQFIYTSSTNYLVLEPGGVLYLRSGTSSNVLVQPGSGGITLFGESGNDSGQVYIDRYATSWVNALTLRSRHSPGAIGKTTTLLFQSLDDGDALTNTLQIAAPFEDATAGAEDSRAWFQTMQNGVLTNHFSLRGSDLATVMYGNLVLAGASPVTISSTAGNLELAPTGDLILDIGGNDVLPDAGYYVNLGSLSTKFLTLHAAELWVETLVAQDTIATIGGRILVGPTTMLAADLTAVATSISVEHNQMTSGDRVYMEANGKVEFMAITSAPSGGGPYTYTVTRNLDGSGANEWNAGDAMFNTGQTGDGFMDLYSYSGVTSGTTGPTIVGNVRQSSTYNDWVEAWAIGNLNGVYGYGVDTYGVGLGQYQVGSYITIDPTSGISMYNSANVLVGQWQPDGDVLIGQVAANKSNVYWDQGTGIMQFRGGAGGTTVGVSVNTSGQLIAGGGDVILDADGITLVEGVTDTNYLKWTESGVTQGWIRIDGSATNPIMTIRSGFGTTQGSIVVMPMNPSGTGETYMQFTHDHFHIFMETTDSLFEIDRETNNETVFNESSLDHDFRVESNGNVNGIMLNAGTNRVGIMRAPTTYEFEVQGTIEATSVVRSNEFYGDDGGPTDPTYTFKNDQDVGTYRNASPVQIRHAVGGVHYHTIGAAGFSHVLNAMPYADIGPISASGYIVSLGIPAGFTGVAYRWEMALYQASGVSSTNYWRIRLRDHALNNLQLISTQSNATGSFVTETWTGSQSMSADLGWYLYAEKVGSPGDLYFFPPVIYFR